MYKSTIIETYEPAVYQLTHSVPKFVVVVYDLTEKSSRRDLFEIQKHCVHHARCCALFIWPR